MVILDVSQMTVPQKNVNCENKKKLNVPIDGRLAEMTKTPSKPSFQIKTIEKKLEQNETSGRSQTLILELNLGNFVDTACDLCFTGFHER